MSNFKEIIICYVAWIILAIIVVFILVPLIIGMLILMFPICPWFGTYRKDLLDSYNGVEEDDEAKT